MKQRLKQAKADASSRVSSRVSSVSSRRSSVARQSPTGPGRRTYSRESSDESELSARYNSQISRTSSRTTPRTTRSFELARARNEQRKKNQFYDSATSVESAASRKRQRSPAKGLKESRKRDMEDINRNIQALTQLLQAIQK